MDQEQFDFALLDLRLPTHAQDMDPNVAVGFAILGSIRDRFSVDTLPVIVMTAFEDSSQTAVRALKAGANDYIKKPFEDSSESLDDKLAGIARHLVAANRATSRPRKADPRHRVVFRKDQVEINGIPVTGRHHDLLVILGKQTFMRTPKEGQAKTMKASAIAADLEVQEATVRKYVNRFRTFIAEEHHRRGDRSVGDQDIVCNTRDWTGYVLNFEACYITCE